MNHTEQFLNTISELNENQRLAVEAIEGPVMVVAGPGTGKTQVLAARIGNILMQTDVYPENILCLTFTEAATVAMRQRLLKFIGPDAYRVGIYTFHGFCNKVIQENPQLFQTQELDAISELDEMKLLHQLIDDFSANHPLSRWDGKNRSEWQNLKKLFKLMKTENLSSQEIISKANEYLDDLPSRDDFIYKRKSTNKLGVFQKGDLNALKFKKEERKMNRLKAAASEFENYQNRMRDKGWFDFHDMIQWVIKAFEEQEDILLDYQEQYQYFLVDEYQDTNGSQNRIVELLTSYHDMPNLFVVGDEDQSIYRFQGANVENITELKERYNEGINLISLNENYRSSQTILDGAIQVIQHNKERLDPTGKLFKAANPKVKSLEVMPAVVSYLNPTQEVIDISNQIVALQKKGEDLSRVVVLYRKHALSDELIKVLQNKKVPIQVRRHENILESQLIVNVVSVLKYVHAEMLTPFSSDDQLFKILHFPFFTLKPIELAKAALLVRYGDVEYRSLRQLINDSKNKQFTATLNEATQTELNEVSQNLEDLIKQVNSDTLQHVVESLINKFGVLAYVMNSPNRAELMQEIKTFFNFLKSETQRNPKLDIAGLLSLIHEIQSSREAGISVPINKTIYSQNSVTLSTFHSAKGLEFKHVFMMGCNSNHWENARSQNKSGYSLPDTLSIAPSGDDIEEQRRLFYVGLTRAEQYLQVSYSQQSDEGKAMEQSQFVAELEDAQQVESSQKVVSEEEYMNYQLALLTQVDKPVFSIYQDELTHQVLEKYSMSVTHLNTYLQCPRSFYFKYILRIPASKNQNMSFGSAVHYALQKLFEKMKDNKEQFPDTSVLLNDFEWFMHKHRESFTKDQFNNKLKHGKRILPAYYDHYVKHWNKVVSVEKSYKNIEVKGVPINGKLDKIEFNGKLAAVVDYKTGQHKKASERKSFDGPDKKKTAKSPKHYHEYGGNYWRQAVFYKILVEQDQLKDWKVISTDFDFVEPDNETGEYIKQSVPVTDDDVTIVTEQIVQAYQRIMNQEFEEGCEEEYCEWCNFVKTNFIELEHSSSEDAEIENE